MYRWLTLVAFVATILVPMPPSVPGGRSALTLLSDAGLVGISEGPRNGHRPGDRRAERAGEGEARGAGSDGSAPPDPASTTLDWQVLGPRSLWLVPAVVVVLAAPKPATPTLHRDARSTIRTRWHQPAHSGIEPARS